MNIAPLAVYLVLGSTGRQLHRRDLHHERAWGRNGWNCCVSSPPRRRLLSDGFYGAATEGPIPD
jgi:hypothetical protein